MNILRLLIVGIGICISSLSFAQSLKVISITRESGVNTQKKDLNGTYCAVVKVQLPIVGVRFEGNIIDTKFQVSEYWVYISPGTKRNLAIKCPNIKTLNVYFPEHDFDKLDSKGIYVLDVEIETDNLKGDENGHLLQEYREIASKANDCFKRKRFSEARNYYEEAIKPKYSSYYDIKTFKWIGLCDTIIKAQSEFKAVTPDLAKAIKGIDRFCELSGFSEGVLVVDHKYGHLSLINAGGERIEVNDAFVRIPSFFSEGLLSVSRINGIPYFINKGGAISLGGVSSTGTNKIFNNSNRIFSQFSNGYSTFYGNKHGIIDRYGTVVLSPTNKFDNIWVLKDEIILTNEKHIYKCPMFALKFDNKIDKNDIYKILDYKGYIWSVTDDYIIIQNGVDTPTFSVYKYGVGLYTIEAWGAWPIDSVHVLCKRSKLGEYGIYNFTTGKWIPIPTNKVVKVIDKNLVFNGKDCYNLSGDIVFSLLDESLCSKSGFIENYMLIKTGDKYRYIDKSGKTLKNSTFKLPDKFDDSHLMSWTTRPFADGFGLIIRKGKWGLIDRFGTTTFDYQ